MLVPNGESDLDGTPGMAEIRAQIGAHHMDY
jgi:hypothetical protein